MKSSLNKLETEGTLRICAVMGCIMTEALEVNDPYKISEHIRTGQCDREYLVFGILDVFAGKRRASLVSLWNWSPEFTKSCAFCTQFEFQSCYR